MECYDRPVTDRGTKTPVLTVLNLKGGVGKTHTAWLVASTCHERGLRVLLIDTDAQGNLTSSFLATDGNQPGVESLLNPATDCDARSLIRRTSFPCIDIIPATPLLMRFDVSDQKQWEHGDLHLSFIDAMDALRPNYDMIVFDCPPRLSLVSFAALCASDCVVIPMEAADWGAQGIVQVTEAIRYVQRRHNSSLRLLGYLVSRFKRRRTYQQSYLNQLRTHFGDLAFDTVIPDLAQFEKSVTDRIPVTVHAPRSEAAGIARRFFDELQARIERQSRIGVGGGPTNLHHTAATVA